MTKRTLGVTAGCPAGIGPEVLARALAEAAIGEELEVVFFGPQELLLEGAARARVPARAEAGEVRLTSRVGRRAVRALGAPALPALPAPGAPDDAALAFQRDALVAACEAAARSELQAIVTGPVRKRALADVGGQRFPGQTELCHHYLARDARPPLMCFAGGPFVLGLATVHLPLREVPGAITKEGLASAIERLAAAAAAVRGRPSPRLVALGLNPHAGEGGLLGDEEVRTIVPALEAARAGGLDVDGPLPADGFFASVHRGEALPDGVLAMFHDQGLAAYKVLAAGRGVNLTWGLKVPRTSPDHGTADALAGRGAADASSTIAALELAARLALAAPAEEGDPP